MEDLIIFLIGIAYVAFRFYKKNIADKKQKPAKSNADNYSADEYEQDDYFSEETNEEEVKSYNKPGNLDEYIRNFFNIEETAEDKIKHDAISEEEIKQDFNLEKEKEKLDNVSEEEGVSDISDPVLNNYSQKQKSTGSKVLKEFDLRKAVIYSEVLKRKYF